MAKCKINKVKYFEKYKFQCQCHSGIMRQGFLFHFTHSLSHFPNQDEIGFRFTTTWLNFDFLRLVASIKPKHLQQSVTSKLFRQTHVGFKGTSYHPLRLPRLMGFESLSQSSCCAWVCNLNFTNCIHCFISFRDRKISVSALRSVKIILNFLSLNINTETHHSTNTKRL